MTRLQEHEAKVASLRRWLSDRGRRAALLTTTGSFAWITAGGEGYVTVADDRAVGAVLVTGDRVVLLTSVVEEGRLLDEELAGLPLERETWPWDEPPSLARRAGRIAGGAGIVADVEGVAGLEWDPALVALRYTLLPPEIERLARLAREAAEALEDAARRVEPGQTEHEIAAAIAGRCRCHGILPITNLVAADDRIARYRHPIPTSRTVRALAMLVLTGRRHGLHVSLTRLVAFGRIDDELDRRHQAVTAVDSELIGASRPGRTLAEVFAEGAHAYRVHGFAEEWRRLHQGGLTGYAGREIFATPVAAHILEAGQGLAWNPSITGTKCEDTILVTGDAPRVLTWTGRWPAATVPAARRAVPRPAILLH